MIFELEPVARDKHGKLIADYSVRDFYEKLAEELLEAHEQAANQDTYCELCELLDIMTVCATRIKSLGIKPYVLDVYQRSLITNNRKRGYLE